MKLNALISVACAAGIVWFGAGCGEKTTERLSDGEFMSAAAPRPAIQVQKVVYWSDVPGMRWDWNTQVTNAPEFVTSSVTNGLATMSFVDDHQWTWSSITNKPSDISAFNNDANYTSASVATNIARQIIHDAVFNVSTNLQTAEDTRAALTNLITILKNL